MYFKDKYAIVTGGASGIGRALCLGLGRRQTEILVLDIDEKGARETVEMVQAAGGRAQARVCDVSNHRDWEAATRETLKRWNRLDFLFNNAGLRPIEDDRVPLPVRYEKIVDVNLKGTLFGCQMALERMEKQGFGHIVNIASVSGIVPGISDPEYSSSKYGIVGLSLTLRMNKEKKGVRVSVVCPSGVATPMLSQFTRVRSVVSDRQMSPEEFVERLLPRVEKNEPIIVIGYMARQLWKIYRFTPMLYKRVIRSLYS